jgi:hypothetical protein
LLCSEGVLYIVKCAHFLRGSTAFLPGAEILRGGTVTESSSVPDLCPYAEVRMAHLPLKYRLWRASSGLGSYAEVRKRLRGGTATHPTGRCGRPGVAVGPGGGG